MWGLCSPPLHPPRRSGLWPNRQLELSGRPGKSQKEGQEEDQETLKALIRGFPPSSFILPWSSWPSLLLFLGLPVAPPNCQSSSRRALPGSSWLLAPSCTAMSCTEAQSLCRLGVVLGRQALISPHISPNLFYFHREFKKWCPYLGF